MHRIMPWLMALSFATSAQAQAQTQAPAKQASTTTAPAPSVDDVLKSLRADMQSTKASIMAKNLTLTAGQAAKFWPAYDAYQKQQNAILDAQLRGIQKYVEGYDTMDDAAALGLMKAHLERDAKITALREKWLGEFQKVLPARLAVRAMQIDRRLSLAAQMEVASQIPLAH